ncbi:hypothetical protein GJAV_G00270170 [Gymnothorax javanicus]|nr:hypothetical protein GJAV_G00270170 [Gymnothorax javanicus]
MVKQTDKSFGKQLFKIMSAWQGEREGKWPPERPTPTPTQKPTSSLPFIGSRDCREDVSPKRRQDYIHIKNFWHFPEEMKLLLG